MTEQWKNTLGTFLEYGFFNNTLIRWSEQDESPDREFLEHLIIEETKRIMNGDLLSAKIVSSMRDAYLEVFGIVDHLYPAGTKSKGRVAPAHKRVK
jgi:hypothetical protein